MTLVKMTWQMLISVLLAVLLTLPSGLGISIAWQRGDEWAEQSLDLLQPPLWMNWIADHNDDPTYAPMVYSLATNAHSAGIAAGLGAPGKTWLLGNEPDLAQTATAAQDAATFTQRWQDEVGAPMACCGVIVHHSYNGGLLWLDEYLAAGGIVGDYWHIHIYFVRSPVEWQMSLNTFKAWMAANDVVRPIIISETAQTESGIDAKPLLAHVAKAVERGDIHAAQWYSDADYWQLWPQSDLRTEDGALTELGAMYLAQRPTGQTAQPSTLYLPQMARQ